MAHSDAIIKQQREVGRETGVVDRNALYWAGMNKVHCRDRLTELQKCKKAGTPCPMDPYAPTRSHYDAPSSAMP